MTLPFDFVVSKGGAYFFLPSISALKKSTHMCDGRHSKLQRQGRGLAHELEVLLLIVPEGIVLLVRRAAVLGHEAVHLDDSVRRIGRVSLDW